MPHTPVLRVGSWGCSFFRGSELLAPTSTLAKNRAPVSKSLFRNSLQRRPRTAQARAGNAIAPSASVGSVLRSRSRIACRVSSLRVSR